MRLFVFLAALLPFSAYANTFCCEAGGRTWCDDGLPQACMGKAYRILNKNGAVIQQVAAPLTPEEKAKKEAELAKQRAEEEKRLEQERQDRKLVSTYPSASDLDFAHERVLNDLKKGQQQMEQKLADTERQKKKLGNEAEFYNTKNPMPAQLKSQIDGNEKALQAQKDGITARAKEIEDTKTRFEEERQRYLKLTTSGSMR